MNTIALVVGLVIIGVAVWAAFKPVKTQTKRYGGGGGNPGTPSNPHYPGDDGPQDDKGPDKET